MEVILPDSRREDHLDIRAVNHQGKSIPFILFCSLNPTTPTYCFRFILITYFNYCDPSTDDHQSIQVDNQPHDQRIPLANLLDDQLINPLDVHLKNQVCNHQHNPVILRLNRRAVLPCNLPDNLHHDQLNLQVNPLDNHHNSHQIVLHESPQVNHHDNRPCFQHHNQAGNQVDNQPPLQPHHPINQPDSLVVCHQCSLVDSQVDNPLHRYYYTHFFLYLDKPSSNKPLHIM